MSDYKELKDAFQKEKKDLYNRLRDLEGNVTKLKKINIIVDELTNNSDDFDVDVEKLYRLKRFFPDLDDMFKFLNRLINYNKLINSVKLDEFDLDGFIKDLEYCTRTYGFPPQHTITDIKHIAEIINNIKQGNVDKISKDDMDLFLGRQKKGMHMLYAYAGALEGTFAMELTRAVIRELKKDEDKDYLSEIDSIKERIALIDKYNPMFTNDKLVTKFASVTDIDPFCELIESLLDTDKCIEILNYVNIDQNYEEKEEITITFDNLDMSIFSPEEHNIVEQLRVICEDEEKDKGTTIFNDVAITYEDRLLAYEKVPITAILSDVDTLLNEIVNNKEEVIRIFKLIIDLYQKYAIRTIREERMMELLKIRDDYFNIENYINKTYTDRSKAYDEEKIINSRINIINLEYLPLIQELISSDYYGDEYFDDELYGVIVKFKTEIKKWKKEMTEYYQTGDIEEDTMENTDNLVFCLTDDINLSHEGFQKEFIGTIESLESKSSRELKKRPGRKGMSKIRKSTENGKEKDFIEYLELKKKMDFHFIPYRYSSDSDYRTGLIKFEPSAKVKEILEEKYGLSKQSAYYGIFEVIEVIRADHSEYSYLEEYILDNCLTIEEIAKLFSSDNPDIEKLTSVINNMLAIKKDKIKQINDSKRM